MATISGKEIKQQLIYDLIGKDSYRGITLSYGWLANQTGHFALGFIPAYLLYLNKWFRQKYTNDALMAACWISLAWLLFEIFNVVKPLINQFISRNKNTKPTFAVPWKNLIYDTSTDLLFFAIGAFFMSCVTEAHVFYSWLMLIVILMLLIIPSRYWYVTKMFQQIAQYPFPYRLNQWNLHLSEANKNTIQKFNSENNHQNHLLLFGENKTGKTSLGVALANEASIQHHKCVYITAIKLLELFFEEETKQIEKNNSMLWDWKQAEILVIDDIQPATDHGFEFIHPSLFKSILQQTGHEQLIKEILAKKQVIWIIGKNSKRDYVKDWNEFLNEYLQIPLEQIYQVQLTKNH